MTSVVKMILVIGLSRMLMSSRYYFCVHEKMTVFFGLDQVKIEIVFLSISYFLGCLLVLAARFAFGFTIDLEMIVL